MVDSILVVGAAGFVVSLCYAFDNRIPSLTSSDAALPQPLIAP